MTDRDIFVRYMLQVAKGNIDPPTCSVCQSLLLHYVNMDDSVYWKCTGCSRVSYPGIAEIKAMNAMIGEFAGKGESD